jgi:hypothetical protein
VGTLIVSRERSATRATPSRLQQELTDEPAGKDGELTDVIAAHDALQQKLASCAQVAADGASAQQSAKPSGGSVSQLQNADAERVGRRSAGCAGRVCTAAYRDAADPPARSIPSPPEHQHTTKPRESVQ